MEAEPQHRSKPLSAFDTYALAVACALAIAALYYNQPILPLIAADFATKGQEASRLVMFSQVGYAAGLFLFVPIGDRLDRRKLISALLLLNTVALAACAAAPSLGFLSIATLAAGLTTVTPQIIIPTVAGLASGENRGRLVGILLSGMSAGLLLGRTVSGFVGEAGGWRAVYILAILLNAPLAAIVWRALPSTHPTTDVSYPRLLVSMWHLFAKEPLLRAACGTGFFSFGAFSVLWATVAILLARPPYNFGVDVIGLFGLIGVISILMTPAIGRIADRFGPHLLISAGGVILVAAFALISQTSQALWALILGMGLIDIGYRAVALANQSRIYPLAPGSHARLNTLLMTSMFLGGAVGSVCGSLVIGSSWTGVAIAGAVFAALVLLVQFMSAR